jgi:hypothetical protein
MFSPPSSPGWLALCLLSAFLVAGAARAQSKAPAKATPPSGARAGSGRKVIKLETLTVEGRIQKPEAFYVLPRSNLNFDELSKPENFVPKIEKSVEKDPF